MDAHRCWAGSTKAAANGVAHVRDGEYMSDEANRTALSRGGMAVVGDIRPGSLGADRLAKIR
jgi:hypothetical protein